MVKSTDGFFALSAQQSVHMRGGLGEDLAPELEQVDNASSCQRERLHPACLPFHSIHIYDLRVVFA